MEFIHSNKKKTHHQFSNIKRVAQNKNVNQNTNQPIKFLVVEKDTSISDYPAFIIIDTDENTCVTLCKPLQDTSIIIKNISDIEIMISSRELIDGEKFITIDDKYTSRSLFYALEYNTWFIF